MAGLHEKSLPWTAGLGVNLPAGVHGCCQGDEKMPSLQEKSAASPERPFRLGAVSPGYQREHFFLAPHWSTWSPVETSKITSLVSLLMRRGAPLWWEAICLPPGSMCPGLLSATHRQCWEPAASSTTVQVGEFNFRLKCH